MNTSSTCYCSSHFTIFIPPHGKYCFTTMEQKWRKVGANDAQNTEHVTPHICPYKHAKLFSSQMTTRQSRKTGDPSAATGKLLFSSENSRRSQEVGCGSPNNDHFQSVPSTRRSTRIFANSGNSVKVSVWTFIYYVYELVIESSWPILAFLCFVF